MRAVLFYILIKAPFFEPFSPIPLVSKKKSTCKKTYGSFVLGPVWKDKLTLLCSWSGVPCETKLWPQPTRNVLTWVKLSPPFVLLCVELLATLCPKHLRGSRDSSHLSPHCNLCSLYIVWISTKRPDCPYPSSLRLKWKENTFLCIRYFSFLIENKFSYNIIWLAFPSISSWIIQAHKQKNHNKTNSESVRCKLPSSKF